MISFYYHPSPNPAKIALFLEESGLAYQLMPVDTRKGEQFAPAFLAINPNGKTPALMDGDAVIFDSTAILLYLADKTGQFLCENTLAHRAELLSWLMFVATGIGPYCGQAVHFRHFAPEPKEYAVNRYTFEAERHWGILDARLGTRRYMVSERYTIVDMAVWGWARAIPRVLGEEAWAQFPHVKRLLEEINARPAAERAAALASQYAFKTDMDDAAQKILFPQNQRLAQEGSAALAQTVDRDVTVGCEPSGLRTVADSPRGCHPPGGGAPFGETGLARWSYAAPPECPSN